MLLSGKSSKGQTDKDDYLSNIYFTIFYNFYYSETAIIEYNKDILWLLDIVL